MEDPEHQRLLSAFQDHLLKLPRARVCPICEHQSFTIAVTGLLEHHTSHARDGKSTPGHSTGAAPVGTVTCKRCGYVYMIDLSVAGIWRA
jgi:rubredoxin